MAAEKKQRKTHRCPPLPSSFEKFQTPTYVEGESVQAARRKWSAYLREVATLRPTPRRTA